jgi:predicted GTPase
MKIINTICFIILLQVNLSLLIDNEASMNYTNKSYFAVIGVTGEGKSSFVNVLSAKSNFKESADGNSETQKTQDIEFDFEGNSLIAIDTPGLDDTLYNTEKIRNLKTLIFEYPTLKCLIIIKKYNNFRLSESLQEAIKVLNITRESKNNIFPKKSINANI